MTTRARDRGERTTLLRDKMTPRTRREIAKWLAGREATVMGRHVHEETFLTDAREMVELLRQDCQGGDAEAAAVSVMVEQAWHASGRVAAQWVESLTQRTTRVMGRTLTLIGLSREGRLEASRAMAVFVLETLRRVESVRAQWWDSRNERSSRRLGWSPTEDPLDLFLREATTGQTGRVFFPHGLVYSPLGRYLRWSGEATVLEVAQGWCAGCGTKAPDWGKCKCGGGPVVVRRSRRLMAVQRLEGRLKREVNHEAV